MKCIKNKGKWLVLLCLVMTIGTGMTSFASSSLKISLDNGRRSDWTDGIQVPTVTVNYSENTPDWSEKVEDWIPGKKVYGTIYVTGTYNRSDCKAEGCNIVSVKNEDGETAIKISFKPVAKLEQPEEAGWSDSAKTKASWKKVPFASRYQVILYKEGGIWIRSMTTSSTTVDFSDEMEDGYKYYYCVKAILKDTDDEDYLKEGDLTTSDDSVIQELGETTGVWSEFVNGKKYRGEDGNFVVNSWRMIKGKWYYFNNNGFAATGWQYLGNHWYYMDTEAQMTTGWKQINGKWYYLNQDGDMATGWVQPKPGKWYYLYSDGSLAMNTTIDGTYNVDNSGLWVSK